MADQKITQLTADTSPSSTDLLKTVKDPAGTPLDRKVTLLDILKGAALGVLTSDGDLFTRTSGALARLTRASLAADAAFSALYAPLVYDGKILGRASLATGGPFTIATSTDTDIDATNLAVTFTVPPSGIVDVVFEGQMDATLPNGYIDWFVRESSSLVGTRHRVFGYVNTVTNQIQQRCYCSIRITGLTPGASKTYKWGWRRASGATTFNLYVTDGPAVMTVRAVAA